jgi:isoaspartyl peptidase/L-asparaginase-like protein (Ntn-hydrolase superfamily)
VEDDPEVTSVGRGGRPDRSGCVSLDAAIMVSPTCCGAVCYVRRFVHAVSIARLVMEQSPHVLLAAEGAERFAVQHGMLPDEPLTASSYAAWKAWLAEHPTAQPAGRRCRTEPLPPCPEPVSAAENLPHNRSHDTIGVLAQDATGRLAGACSTSGIAFKLPGRVGDSPIIGHGLYVDPQYGAAVGTGTGELLMGVCAAFLAVELLRRNLSPADAAAEVLQRIIDRYPLDKGHQAALIVLSAAGRWGSASLRPGFRTALRTPTQNELVEPDRVMLP